MNPMIMAAVADYIKNQQQDAEARETGQQQIAQKHAASLGYPTYGMQAAQLNSDIEEGDDASSYVADFMKARAARGRE